MAGKSEVAEKKQELVIDSSYIDKLSKQLENKQQYGLTFPTNYSVSNALNSAYLMLQETYDRNKRCVLQACSPQSIASALVDMTVQALNPMKKQCYFVAYGDKLTLMRSYQGTLAIAKRVGVKKVVAEVIYEGDEFSYSIIDGIKVIDKHIQDFKNINTDKLIGAYAVVTTDNGTYTEVMNIAQLEKAWSKGYGYKKGQGVHGDFTDQMAKKTVISRACKSFVNSSDDAYLMESDDDTDRTDNKDVVAESVAHEIEANANTVEFIDDIPEAVTDQLEEFEEPEAVDDTPDFMKD